MSDVDSGVDSGNEDSFEQGNALNIRQMADNEDDDGMNEDYNDNANNNNNLNNNILNNAPDLEVNKLIDNDISLLNSNLNEDYPSYEHYLMTIPSTSSQQPIINYANIFSKFVNNQIQNQPQSFLFTKYRENRFQPKIKINFRNSKLKSSFYYFHAKRYEIKEKVLRNAARTGNVEFLCQIISNNNGLNLNSQDKMLRTALHFAVANNHFRIASILLDHGANPNLSDIGGNTPLHLAVCTSKLDMVILLLKNGANCSLLDSNGFTPIRLAKSRLHYLANSKQAISIDKIRNEALQILSMLGIYSKNTQMKKHETEVASFKNRIEASKTTHEIEKDVSDLLECLENWSL